MVLLTFAIFACIVLCFSCACCLAGVVSACLFRWQWILQHGPGFTGVVGMAGILLFTEAWNLFFPVNHQTVAIFGGFLLVSAIGFRRTLTAALNDWIKNRSVLAILLLLLLLVTVSLFGLGPLESLHHDTGLYYLNTIRWACAYPAVPGLANLHFRLGFNQSLLLFVALLSKVANLGLARACQIANPVVVFVSGWAILDCVRLNLAIVKAKRVRLYAILLICPLFFFATNIVISTPTGDIGSAVLALPGVLAFFCCLQEVFAKDFDEARNWLVLLAVCGCTVVKLKLSYICFAAVAVCISAVLLTVVQPRNFYWSWIKSGTIIVTLTLPWTMRGVILSGYPLFPSTLIGVPADWAVPHQYANEESRWIYSWARLPGGDPESVLKNEDWIFPWFGRNAESPENIYLFLFMSAGLISALLSLLFPVTRKQRVISVLLIGQASLAVIFWFRTAPDPRFGYAALLLIGVNAFYSFANAIGRWSSFFATLITAIFVCAIYRNEWQLMNDYPLRFPCGFPKANIEYRITESGLHVGIPKGEQAWDSGFVVTPEFDRYLSLRGGSLRDGFRTKFDETDEGATAH